MNEIVTNTDYRRWIGELKQQIRSSQIKATLSVNSQMIMLYWDMGKQIVEKQATAKWGSGFIKQLSKDLQEEFPDMSGFSVNNLFRIKQFYIYYSKASFSEQLVPQTEIQLTSILEQDVSKLQNAEIQNDTKVAQVAPQLPATEKQELTISTQVVQNFLSIPWGHHILIMQKVKDTEEALFYVQKTLENNWSRAVLEYQIETNLYSRQGKAVTNFSLTLPQPESDLANEMMKEPYNFDFIRLINRLVKDDSDKPTIGILLCKNKNNYVVDFSLSNVSNPIGVSTFHYTELAEDIKAALPSAEMLQNELINFERQHYGKK